MDGSALYHEASGIKAYNLLAGETFSQNAQGAVICFGLVEDGYDNGPIADKEIGITGRQLFQSPVFGYQRLRHGQGDNLNLMPGGGA